MNRRKLLTGTAAVFLSVAFLAACARQEPVQKEMVQKEMVQERQNDGQTGQETKTTLKYNEMKLIPDGITVEPGAAYYLPLGEGKYVPADDETWKEYLTGQEFSALENLSMPFIAVDRGESAQVYVMENPYRTKVVFTASPDLGIKLVGEESSLDPSPVNIVRV